MRYITPRKRAEGRGAAHAGTEHHWSMTVSAVGLAFLVPVWLYVSVTGVMIYLILYHWFPAAA